MDSSLDVGIEFDISRLPDALRTDELLKRPNCTHVLLGHNDFIEEVIHTYVYEKPSYMEPHKMIYCDHTDWYQYQLLQHLPWAVIVHYFKEKYNV